MRQTKILILIFMAICYISWIQPLGIFIKPSQEKFVCGGKRAICMCGHEGSQAKAKAMQGFALQNNSNNSEETNVSGGLNLYCLPSGIEIQRNLCAVVLSAGANFDYQNTYYKSIDHVPKNA